MTKRALFFIFLGAALAVFCALFPRHSLAADGAGEETNAAHGLSDKLETGAEQPPAEKKEEKKSGENKEKDSSAGQKTGDAKDKPVELPAPTYDYLERATAAYEYGDYGAAIKLATQALKHELSPKGTKDALVILGLSHYILKEYNAATETLSRLLFADPYYKLDPFYAPPQIIDFYENLRVQLEPKLRPIKEKMAADGVKNLDNQPPVNVVEVKYVQNSKALNLLPFGVGQFQNEHYGKGYALLVGEIFLIAVNVGAYLTVKALAGSDGKYSHDGAQAAKAMQIVQYSAAGLFGALWAYGAVDGMVYFVPEKKIVLNESPFKSAKKESVSAPLTFAAAIGFGF